MMTGMKRFTHSLAAVIVAAVVAAPPVEQTIRIEKP